jgi:hypothetical protein
VLVALPWTQWATWGFQVMGLFFFVGGYANAASWSSARAARRPYGEWLASRTTRLVRPTTVFVGVCVLATVAARALGLDPTTVRNAAWLIAIALWFLVVYLVVVALTPVLVASSDRFGARAATALVVAAIAADLARWSTGIDGAAVTNFLIVWLVPALLGAAWRAGALTRSRTTGWGLLLAGGATLIVLTVPGPYPVSMVAVPGADLQNTSPPTVALLALIVAQIGLALLIAEPVRRWLDRPRVWTGVIAVNAVIMTVFLWHMVPVVVAALALHATGLVPTSDAGSWQWFALRPVWIGACAIVLAALIAVFARFERPDRRDRLAPRSRWVRGRGGDGAVVAGVVLIVAGILQLTVEGFQGAGPAGTPLLALITYAVGLGLLAQGRRGVDAV